MVRFYRIHLRSFSISEHQLFHRTYRHHYFTSHTKNTDLRPKKKKIEEETEENSEILRLCVCVHLLLEFQWNADIMASFTFHWDHLTLTLSISFTSFISLLWLAHSTNNQCSIFIAIVRLSPNSPFLFSLFFSPCNTAQCT